MRPKNFYQNAPLILLFTFGLVGGCKKDKQQQVQDPKTLPVVTTMMYFRYDGYIYTDGPRYYHNFILNNLGVPNSDILINGHNFSQDFKESTVRFNNISAAALDGDSTRIVVRIPDNVAPGPVTLTILTNGKSIVHPTKFTVEAPSPQLTSVSTEGGMVGSKLIIHGSDFSTTVANNQVTVNGVNAKVDSAGLTAIYVTVPQNSGSGKITVKTWGSTLTYKNNFKTTTSTFSILDPATIGIAVRDLVTDEAGNLYGTTANTVYKITPNGTKNILAQIPASPDAIPYLAGCAVDASGNVYVSSPYVSVPSRASIQINGPSKIYKITAAGMLSVFARGEYPGHADGNGDKALFQAPRYIALDASGNLYVNDVSYTRKVTPDGTVTTLSAAFPGLMAVDKSTGDLYTIESAVTNGTFTARVKKMDINGVTTITEAGPMADTYVPGIYPDKTIYYPIVSAITIDPSGNILAVVGANLYKIRGSTITNTFLNPTTRNIEAIALDPSGKLYLTLPVNEYNLFGNDKFGIYKVAP